LIRLKNAAQLKKMRAAGLIVAEVLEGLRDVVRPGVTTRELDEFAAEVIASRGAEPAFKGVRGPSDVPPFPAVICASVNEELVHGVPSSRVLQEGDIVTVDVGCKLDGFYGDAARTYPVGRISPEAERLVETTRECLEAAIARCRPGNWLFDISRAVERLARSRGYSVVEDYVGHGIGRELHEDPQVPNYVPRGASVRNVVLRSGMVLAIEPMINEGTHRTYRPRGKWTVRTADGKLCAHFENTVAILDGGCAVLTTSEPCSLDEV